MIVLQCERTKPLITQLGGIDINIPLHDGCDQAPS